ncbi:dihydrolipoyl dehydrogenase [Rhizobium lusitanum]|uniref:Dihydrolipoyl dehydrogenase n=1 Tax=Rhizobium lusitanum TaxID=293958 RepID=A0A6L9UG21_9HYPH|nr:dihydrolipoyl dehydrogenase [Rhizobium lusitanum]NEI74584.1 dihydrolipoyl dehydrogenase [Rhizobium lusitanum]
MTTVEILIPDLGDFKDVLVAEVFVKPGDIVVVEQPVASVETDKATMDIPSPAAGTIGDVKIKIGDKVGKGTLLATLALAGSPQSEAPMPIAAQSASVEVAAQPSAGAAVTAVEGAYDLVVIGGGPGGYSAAFRAADLGLRVALIEHYQTLGGVCLNVGCIPSKALLHVAAIKEEAERLGAHGVSFPAPVIDIDKLRAFKDATIRKLTDGLAQMAKMRKVERITGTAQFAGSHHLLVSAGGSEQRVDFTFCIIAAGSTPVSLPFLPSDPRIVNSTGALALAAIPARMLVIGGGIIGLEMATVYSALGAKIDVVEQLDGLLAGVDRDLVSIWQKRNAHRFDRIMLATRLQSVSASEESLTATFDADQAKGDYDLILQAAGRRPNGDSLNLAAAEIRGERGFIAVDQEMRTNVPHIFAIGDIVGQPMLAHKAVHEGHVAAEVAAGHKTAFEPVVIPSVAYLDPEIAWVGVTEDSAKENGMKVKVARFPWAASGRAIANGAEYGMTKLVFSSETGRIVGGAIIGPNAGDMIGEVCLAIELGADAVDIGRTIHPHPTLGETIGMAAEVAEGSCTDLPPSRRS